MENLEQNIDRRIIRTRHMIYETFLALMSEKDFVQISVKDITHQANISRSTFYAHYKDKYDLLDKIIEDKLSILNELLAKSNLPKNAWNNEVADPFFVTYFECIATNYTFYKQMFMMKDSNQFSTKLYHVIRESLSIRFSRIEKERKFSIPLDILLDYSTSSLLGVTKVWVENHMIYSPNYIALQFTRLSINGIYPTMKK